MSSDAAMPSLQKWEPRRLTDLRASELDNVELHYWLLPLQQSTAVFGDLAESLSADELARASRFHFERDRQHFIAARGLLRRLIGHYAGKPADSIRFRANAYGKPGIETQAGPESLEFNLSHSGDWAFAAFARGTKVGVDIEQMRNMPDMIGIAEDNFSAGEVASLKALPAERQADGFFSCWTRKEAYVKAVGLGLSLDLKTFDVSVEPSHNANEIRTPETGSTFRIEGLRPFPGYWAATAAETREIVAPPLTGRLSKYFALAT
jgi:4'-phosphopantetheinyl transferase